MSGIVEKNPRKFKIEDSDLRERRSFIDGTRTSVKVSVALNLQKICRGCYNIEKEEHKYYLMFFLSISNNMDAPVGKNAALD